MTPKDSLVAAKERRGRGQSQSLRASGRNLWRDWEGLNMRCNSLYFKGPKCI